MLLFGYCFKLIRNYFKLLVLVNYYGNVISILINFRSFFLVGSFKEGVFYKICGVFFMVFFLSNWEMVVNV